MQEHEPRSEPRAESAPTPSTAGGSGPTVQRRASSGGSSYARQAAVLSPRAPVQMEETPEEDTTGQMVGAGLGALGGIALGPGGSLAGGLLGRAIGGAIDPWRPQLSKTKTTFKSSFGNFEATHGLESLPGDPSTPDPYGLYYFMVEMEPTAACGDNDIAFVQVTRTLDEGGRPQRTQADGLSKARAAKTETTGGWRVDRANESRDKTPFYGMRQTSSGALTSYSTSRVGRHGGAKAMMRDRPGFYEYKRIEFVATATNMSDGSQYGAVAWGFTYDSANQTYNEETPRLIDSGNARVAGRDRAYTKWNEDIATESSGIGEVPTPPAS